MIQFNALPRGAVIFQGKQDRHREEEVQEPEVPEHLHEVTVGGFVVPDWHVFGEFI